MRAVVQKVSSSKVTVDEEVIGEINQGLLVLLGVTHDDTSKDVDYMVDKVTNLRIFEDEDEKMNLSLKDVGGEILVFLNLPYMEMLEKEEDQVFLMQQDQKWQILYMKNL